MAGEIDDEVFVVGGAQVYAEALPLADRLALTFVDAEPEGDTVFPEVDWSQWRETARRRAGLDARHLRARGSVRAMSEAGEVLTQEQREALETELAELQGPRRAAAIEAIATARSFGDLSENFEYHAAKNDQGLLEARIAKLRERLRTAVVVEHDTDDHVGPGRSSSCTTRRARRWRSRSPPSGGSRPTRRSDAR